jgi:mevalonate pyrophosphate decarboxylase
MDDKENKEDFVDIDINEIAGEELNELHNNPKEVIYHELNHEDDDNPDTTYNELTNIKGNFFRKWFNRIKKKISEDAKSEKRRKQIRDELIRDGIIKDDNDD